MKDFDADAVDRPQAGAAHGPLRAADRRRRAPGRGRLRARRSQPEPDRIGASIATGIGGLKAFQDCYDRCSTAGPTASTRSRSPRSSRTWAPAGSRWSSARRARSASQCTACAASNMAIGDGMRRDPARPRRRDALRRHRGARSRRSGSPASARCARSRGGTTTPSSASRPFDAGRDGFVMGEAGAVLVLEELEHAKARGAKIYAELLGYGALVRREAHHRARPDRREPGARDADGVRRRGHRARREIGYINAHGTSTPLGDASETRVIKLALGEENALQDAGLRRRRARPATASARRARSRRSSRRSPSSEGVLPPTINYEEPDPDVRPRLHPERVARGGRRGRRLELVRLRRAQRLHRAAALGRLTPSVKASRLTGLRERASLGREGRSDAARADPSDGVLRQLHRGRQE